MPFAATDRALVERLDRCLPQTQCTRCGYPRCRDYAQAIARGEADINRCPPGDEVTIRRLADALGRDPTPLDPSVGPRTPRRRALIDESRCIGCAKCLDACPVDAIVGAYQWMHTVVAAQCTGCELCVARCPVDCIGVIPTARPAGEETPWPDYTREETDAWRAKTNARLARLGGRESKRVRTKDAARPREAPIGDTPSPAQMRDEIRAAIERVKRKRATDGRRR